MSFTFLEVHFSGKPTKLDRCALKDAFRAHLHTTTQDGNTALHRCLSAPGASGADVFPFARQEFGWWGCAADIRWFVLVVFLGFASQESGCRLDGGMC